MLNLAVLHVYRKKDGMVVFDPGWGHIFYPIVFSINI